MFAVPHVDAVCSRHQRPEPFYYTRRFEPFQTYLRVLWVRMLKVRVLATLESLELSLASEAVCICTSIFLYCRRFLKLLLVLGLTKVNHTL